MNLREDIQNLAGIPIDEGYFKVDKKKYAGRGISFIATLMVLGMLTNPITKRITKENVFLSPFKTKQESYAAHEKKRLEYEQSVSKHKLKRKMQEMPAKIQRARQESKKAFTIMRRVVSETENMKDYQNMIDSIEIHTEEFDDFETIVQEFVVNHDELLKYEEDMKRLEKMSGKGFKKNMLKMIRIMEQFYSNEINKAENKIKKYDK